MSCVRRLSEAGANPDSPDTDIDFMYNEYWTTVDFCGRPIEIARDMNHLDIVDLLVNHCGIDLDYSPHHEDPTVGFSLLVHCVEQNHLPLVKSLR